MIEQPPVDDANADFRAEEVAEPRKFAKAPNPRPWARNNDAGIEFLTRTEPYEAQIAFVEKPSEPVREYLKKQGFHWNSKDKAWAHPIRFDTQAQDRESSRRAYDEVVQMALAEKGLEAAAQVHF